MIDWNLALTTAAKLSRPGPEMSAAEASEAVAELREGAARSEGPVREFSELHARSATAPILVVDRTRWVEANIDSFKVLMDPIAAKLAASGKQPTGMARTIGEKVSGAEVGALMSFMSTKVLGQAADISSALVRTSPGRSTRAVRRSRARPPMRTGRWSRVSNWRSGLSWKGPKEKVRARSIRVSWPRRGRLCIPAVTRGAWNGQSSP